MLQKTQTQECDIAYKIYIFNIVRFSGKMPRPKINSVFYQMHKPHFCLSFARNWCTNLKKIALCGPSSLPQLAWPLLSISIIDFFFFPSWGNFCYKPWPTLHCLLWGAAWSIVLHTHYRSKGRQFDPLVCHFWKKGDQNGRMNMEWQNNHPLFSPTSKTPRFKLRLLLGFVEVNVGRCEGVHKVKVGQCDWNRSVAPKQSLPHHFHLLLIQVTT